jgi:hypothetical protein
MAFLGATRGPMEVWSRFFCMETVEIDSALRWQIW